ncbi:MAG: hypothetical protein PWP46_2083 [Fusobacteriaceae bacterium]|jgi:glycosyltransferase involved in cell wall biosynthesis|nr:hypothetical protein [Fusobacteriales bacterium]MDN5305196.1 hypothetical protein [Fusobacteriaceae bacterium]
MNEKVLVVIYSKNNIENIERTILSIILQNFSNLEILIIDFMSNDYTLKLEKKYETQFEKISVISINDENLISAKEYVKEYALKGNFTHILLLPANYMMTENSLNILISHMNKTPTDILLIPKNSYSNYKNLLTEIRVFRENILNTFSSEINIPIIEDVFFAKINILSHFDISKNVKENIKDFISIYNVKRITDLYVLFHEEKVTYNNLFDKNNIKLEKEKFFFNRYFYYKNIIHYLKNPIFTILMIFYNFIVLFKIKKYNSSKNK